MISLRTNMSSLIAQNSFLGSTKGLNLAIERMSTGYKINHASDNAANYSISTDMTTKLGAYQIAEDNVSMGLDMLSSVNDTLDLITSHLQRIRDLSMQASNDTFGDDSIEAINAEICARVDEIQRLSANAEYNGINVFKGTLVGTEEASFIKEVDRRNTDNMTALSSINPAQKLESGTYSISTAAELAQLATMTNNDLIGLTTEFVMTNDIDLSAYSNWTPIGNNDVRFNGTFDGNGYKITGLKINRPDEDNVGLFGYAGSTSYIANLNIENASVVGNKHVGIIAGECYNIYNCITSGYLSASGMDSGGVAGQLHSSATIDSCYSTATISSSSKYVGGIVGYLYKGSIKCCSYKGTLSSSTYAGYAGGIAGSASGTIEGCYSEGNCSASYSGGIVGSRRQDKFDLIINNCYTSMNIQGLNCGGIVGIDTDHRTTEIKNCAVLNSTSNLKGLFVGNKKYEDSQITIENCSYNSAISSPTKYVGNVNNSDITTSNITTNDGTAPYIISKNANINLYNDTVSFQVGINSDSSSQIGLTMGYSTDKLSSLKTIISSTRAQILLSYIDDAISEITSKQVEYGAVQNRLESALESISVNYDNLLSSRSTLRDADMGELSSTYIQKQILQQAAATLMATANQSPSIALQLI